MLDSRARRYFYAWLSTFCGNSNPGFKRSDVDFRSALDEALNPRLQMKTTNSLHIIDSMDATKPLVIQGEQTSLRTDDNNVDIDMELATLAENNLYFNSLAHFLSSQLSLLRQSISEGRG